MSDKFWQHFVSFICNSSVHTEVVINSEKREKGGKIDREGRKSDSDVNEETPCKRSDYSTILALAGWPIDGAASITYFFLLLRGSSGVLQKVMGRCNSTDLSIMCRKLKMKISTLLGN